MKNIGRFKAGRSTVIIEATDFTTEAQRTQRKPLSRGNGTNRYCCCNRALHKINPFSVTSVPLVSHISEVSDERVVKRETVKRETQKVEMGKIKYLFKHLDTLKKWAFLS
jgi:hypothetical protein